MQYPVPVRQTRAGCLPPKDRPGQPCAVSGGGTARLTPADEAVSPAISVGGRLTSKSLVDAIRYGHVQLHHQLHCSDPQQSCRGLLADRHGRHHEPSELIETLDKLSYEKLTAAL